MRGKPRCSGSETQPCPIFCLKKWPYQFHIISIHTVIQYHNSCAFMRHISYVIHIQVVKIKFPISVCACLRSSPVEGRNSSNVAPTWPFFLSDLGYREYGMQNASHVVSHLKYSDIYGGFLKWDPKSPWVKLY